MLAHPSHVLDKKVVWVKQTDAPIIEDACIAKTRKHNKRKSRILRSFVILLRLFVISFVMALFLLLWSISCLNSIDDNVLVV